MIDTEATMIDTEATMIAQRGRHPAELAAWNAAFEFLRLFADDPEEAQDFREAWRAGPSAVPESVPESGMVVAPRIQLTSCARCGRCESNEPLWQGLVEGLTRRGWQVEWQRAVEWRGWQIVAYSPTDYIAIVVSDQLLFHGEGEKMLEHIFQELLDRIDSGQVRPYVEGECLEFDPVIVQQQHQEFAP